MATLTVLASKLLKLSATMASNTLGAVLIEGFGAKIHKEFGRFWSFHMDKKQLHDKLSSIRGFLEFANTQKITDEQTLAWLLEIKKKVSDAEADLCEIGENDPSWLSYNRRHAITVEQHSGKLDYIANLGSGIYSRYEIRQLRSPIVEPYVDGCNKGDITRVFEKFDTNGDGKISSLELKDVMRSVGIGLSVEEVMDAIGTDVDGFIDLKQFNELHEEMKRENDYQDLLMAFELYGDDDGDGKISFHDLAEMLKAHGSEISVDKLRNMMLKKLGKKRSVDEASSSDSGGSGTTERNLKRVRTELKA